MSADTRVAVHPQSPTFESTDEAARGLAALLEDSKGEQSGAIIRGADGKFRYTTVVPGTENQFTMRVQLRQGEKLGAIMHSHPGSDNDASVFSPHDIDVADQLKVPSYVKFSGEKGAIRSYTTGKTKTQMGRAQGYGVGMQKTARGDELAAINDAGHSTAAQPAAPAGDPGMLSKATAPSGPATVGVSGMALTSSGATGGTLSAGAAATGGMGTPPAYNRQTSTGTGTPNTVDSYAPPAPTPTTFDASTATASQTGAAPTAAASLAGPQAGITGGMINPNDASNAASQLNAITASGSPYMEQARQQGLLSAASRGLQNSSLGAGAAEAAAVQAAAPLAEQNAQESTAGQLQNSQLGTQANEFNAGQQNANQQLNAQLNTQTSQFNASNQQQAAAANAQMINTMKEQTQSILGQLGNTALANSGAQTLASIQAEASKSIATTQATTALMQSTLSGISSIMTNNNLDATRSGIAVQAELNTLNSILKATNAIYGGNTGTVTSTAPTTTTPTRFPIGKR